MKEFALARPGADIYCLANIISDNVVFLINGYSRTSSDFRAMIDFLAKQNISAVTCDNRGAGRSRSKEVFSIADMAEDVVSVLDSLSLSRVNFVGISMGGLILQKLVEIAPERVEKLVFVSSTAEPQSIDSNNHGWPDSEEQIIEKMKTYFSEPFVSKNKLLIKAMAANICKSITNGEFLLQSSYQSKAISELRLDHSMDPLPFTSLVIHGKEDNIIAPVNAENLAARFDHVNLHLYPGVGHLLIAECGKRLYADIASFINNS